jgi:hypothetical protein
VSSAPDATASIGSRIERHAREEIGHDDACQALEQKRLQIPEARDRDAALGRRDQVIQRALAARHAAFIERFSLSRLCLIAS